MIAVIAVPEPTRNEMSIEDNKRLVRRYYEEIFNTGDVDQIASFVSPEYVEVHDHVRHPIGVEGARAHVLGVRAVYRDLALTIDRQIAEGPWVVSCVTMRGVHVGGEWQGIKPSGKSIAVAAVNVDKVVEGRIVEHSGAANLLLPLLMSGAVRAAEPDDD